nr:MarR family transcriptional regulator [Bacteroidota bacterium]
MIHTDNTFERLYELTSVVHAKVKRLLETKLRPYNLTFGQYGTLIILTHTGNLSQKQLADYLETDTTNMMVICDALERKKLIRRIAHPTDRRAKHIELTDYGKQNLGQAMPAAKSLLDRMDDAITGKETCDTIKILEKLLERLKALDS